MKFIGLVAGRGKRLRPVTDYLHKPMYPIFDKPFLAYTLENLMKFTDEVILVTLYKGWQVKTFFGTNWNGLKISYVDGSTQGPAASLLQPFYQLRVNEDAVVWLGDIYLSQPLIAKMLSSPHRNVLTVTKVDFRPAAPVEIGDGGKVLRAWGGESFYNDIGFWKFQPELFGYFEDLPLEKRPLMGIQRFMDDGHEFHWIEADHWVHLGYVSNPGSNRESLMGVVDFFWGL